MTSTSTSTSTSTLTSTSSIPTGGVVILCDRQGVIEKVVHDASGLAPRLKVGQLFASAIGARAAGDESQNEQTSGRETEVARFMETLRDAGYASGCEITLPVEGHQAAWRFTGGATSEGVLIVGSMASEAASDAARLVEELTRINNETVNALRAALKQVSLSIPVQTERDDELLAELSRSNNSVMTAQRELAKKNAVLSQTNAALEAAQIELKAKQAALEEANIRLDALATTDGLTGVKNRRAFGEKLAGEVLRSARYGAPLSLLLLDVDKFKQYNDSFGHPAGDEVLKTVARVLGEQARTTDFVARYGGEEFTLVLPNTGAEGSLVLAERLRVAIESTSWPNRAVTASFGAATWTSEINTDTALIDAADRALYTSKENGRNRVTHINCLPETSE